MTARALPSVSDDERIMPLLNSLTTAYVGEDYSNTKFEVCGQTSLSSLRTLYLKKHLALVTIASANSPSFL